MWSAVLTLACALSYVSGHGRVVEPPNRASIWRYGYDSPANYDDDGLNCGGFYTQWSINDGRLVKQALNFSQIGLFIILVRNLLQVSKFFTKTAALVEQI